jgi:hypothetical protein
MLALLEAIRFLPPPTGCGPVRMDRFSPYFMQPAEYGLTHVRPLAAYRFLYPFEPEQVHNIAYHFDFDYASGRQAHTYAEKVIAFVHQWQAKPEEGSLRAYAQSAHEMLLVDTRSDARQSSFKLSDVEKEIYAYCDEVRTLASIKQFLRKKYPQRHVTDENLLAFLDSLRANGLMIADQEFYLSLSLGLSHPAAQLAGAFA